jgi:hypothetical protein
VENKITVTDLLHEHMKYLAERAVQAERGSKEEKALIGAMEDIQALMNRLDVPDGDQFCDKLLENRIFLRLSYDSKVLVLAHTRRITALIVAIGKLIDFLEHHPKIAEKIRRSFTWKLLRLIALLPWGR